MDRDSCKKRMKKLARKTKELAEEVEAKDEMARLVEKEQQEVQIAAIGCIYDRSKVKKFIGDVATRSPSVKSGQVRQNITCKLCGKEFRKDSYLRHCAKRHPNGLIAPKREQRVYECADCDYTSTRKHNMNLHRPGGECRVKKKQDEKAKKLAEQTKKHRESAR